MDLGLALLGGGALGALGSFLGGNQQAKAQQAAADASNAFAGRVWDETAPYRAAGTRFLNTYENAVNQPFQNTPGYQFAFDEGMRAIKNQAAARGLLNSGARLRASARYATGLADQTYQNWLAALRSGAGLGQTGMQTGIAGAGNAVNAAGQFGAGAGASQGASFIGAANSLGGGLNQLAALQYYGLPKRVVG